ncbi:MAG TPA: YdeI/OmpD-associated family protein [Acidimicrobiales bacterium]|nr:YdeI/OmpD-associated family protein [Acidimicrobiales bacterium]
MPEPQQFTAELHPAGRGGSAFDVPHGAAAALSDSKRPPVTVTIGGHTFRTRIAVYGGQPMVGVSKANRTAAGIDFGDRFEATVALDEEPRVIEVPDDLATALAGDAEAAAAFEHLAYTHRREYVIWITEAKRPETRARRVAGTLDKLRGGE